MDTQLVMDNILALALEHEASWLLVVVHTKDMAKSGVYIAETKSEGSGWSNLGRKK